MVPTCSVEVGVPGKNSFLAKLWTRAGSLKLFKYSLAFEVESALVLQSRKVSQSVEFLTCHSPAFCTLQLVIHAICDSKHLAMEQSANYNVHNLIMHGLCSGTGSLYRKGSDLLAGTVNTTSLMRYCARVYVLCKVLHLQHMLSATAITVCTAYHWWTLSVLHSLAAGSAPSACIWTQKMEPQQPFMLLWWFSQAV